MRPLRWRAALLLRGLEASLPPAATLLDIGGGVGVLHRELLDRGVSHAWEVDPPTAFLQPARDSARTATPILR
jgi:16S rRNA A1518/A1519 N6-dimethyltransferase RsmA/KsgA/DIM1 with predicted DNA glycosylase/AP lyase activity